MQRIHIVGCGPRTGTTLIAEMMIACFEIDLYTTHEASIYAQPPHEGNIFLTKHPRDILIVGPMLCVMQNLHVIYMLRDPRDMVSSKHGKDRDRYWASLRYWKAYTPYGRKLQQHPRFLTVRYEDLVTQPDEIQTVLMQQMPFLVKRAPFSRYHELAHPSSDSKDALGGCRPVTSVSIGNWRKHLPRLVGQLQKHGSITQDLIDYGYELDDRWLSELNGIAPDFSESHWEEYFTQAELKQRMQGKYLMAALQLLRGFGLRRSRLRQLLHGSEEAMKITLQKAKAKDNRTIALLRLVNYLRQASQDTELHPILQSYIGRVPLSLFSEPRLWFRALASSQSRFRYEAQRPYAFYAPHLKASPFYPPDAISKYLEDNAAAIAEEFARVAPLEIGTPSKALVARGVWNTFPLRRASKDFQSNIDRCPVTWKIVQQCPLIQGVEGAVYFSIIYPGTEVNSHCGPSNLKRRYHLTLEEAEGAQIRAGNEWRTWRQGECLILDDAFEHEVRHSGNRRRVVLIIDCWHPDLSEKERSFLTHLHQIWQKPKRKALKA